MNRLVLDIETVGLPPESLSEDLRNEVERWASQSDKPEMIYEELGLHELTGFIAAVGMLNIDTGKGRVVYQPETAQRTRSRDGQAEFIPGSEKEILEKFWQTVVRYDQVITFNGRGFDIPFILNRSAVHRVKATRNLMPNRYYSEAHLDLLDHLTYFGAARRHSLHYYCMLFGIESPKNMEIEGREVDTLWQEGKYEEIVEYCWRDVKATAELFMVWSTYIRPTGDVWPELSSPGDIEEDAGP